MHWLDSLWVKNKLVSLLRPAKWSPMVQFANKREEETRCIRSGKGKQPGQQSGLPIAFYGRFGKGPVYSVIGKPSNSPRNSASRRMPAIVLTKQHEQGSARVDIVQHHRG